MRLRPAGCVSQEEPARREDDQHHRDGEGQKAAVVGECQHAEPGRKADDLLAWRKGIARTVLEVQLNKYSNRV